MTIATCLRTIEGPPRLRALIVNILERLWTVLKEFGPYAAIELILPGGSCLALLLWLYRRHQRLAKVATSTRVAPATTGCRMREDDKRAVGLCAFSRIQVYSVARCRTGRSRTTPAPA